MNIIAWVILGLIVGIVAAALDDEKGGILSYMFLGVGGALLGGFVADIVFGGGISGFNVSSFLVASFCAISIMFLGRAMRRV